MKTRSATMLVVVVACGAAVAFGATYGWQGRGADDDWDTCANWAQVAGVGEECYPSSTSDDATILNGAGTWDVDLIDGLTIDDFSIVNSVDFYAADQDPVLKVDSLTIGSTNGAVVVTITDGEIQTVDITE